MDTQILNYEITWDELEIEGEGKIPESLKPRLQDLSDDARNGKPGVIDQLKKLIKKYPSIVQLKNYLYVAYQAMDNLEKATQINDQILEQHPDYLFARIHKAYKYYQDGEHEKMPELLGKGFDLQILYPNRDIFHISEFLAMQGMAVRYFSANGELEEVENRLKLMKEMDGDALQTEVAEKIYRKSVLEKGLERMKKEKERRIAPENQFHLKKIEFNRPEFNIPTTADLYHHDLDIPEEVLRKFFDHDRDQVIEDLENVLKDSYYNYTSEDNNHSDEPFAPLHAFFLLGDLEAEESLPVVLEMMEQNEDYLNDVFGDLFSQSGWIPLFKMGKNQLNSIVEYLKLPGTDTFFKSAAVDALEQLWHHFPQKRPDLEGVFGELLEYVDSATPEDNVIDTVFNELLISSLINLKLVQFLPQIKSLYEKGYATDSVSGTFDDVKEEILRDYDPTRSKRELETTNEVYDSFHTISEVFSGIDPSEQFNHQVEPVNQPVVRTSKKIGRNDPCPCGSGKKYKKCCLRKN